MMLNKSVKHGEKIEKSDNLLILSPPITILHYTNPLIWYSVGVLVQFLSLHVKFRFQKVGRSRHLPPPDTLFKNLWISCHSFILFYTIFLVNPINAENLSSVVICMSVVDIVSHQQKTLFETMLHGKFHSIYGGWKNPLWCYPLLLTSRKLKFGWNWKNISGDKMCGLTVACRSL